MKGRENLRRNLSLALTAVLLCSLQINANAATNAKEKSDSQPVQACSIADNPKVKPGSVNWYHSFAQACQAANRSHKPVLLFQMLGRLDEKFC